MTNEAADKVKQIREHLERFHWTRNTDAEWLLSQLSASEERVRELEKGVADLLWHQRWIPVSERFPEDGAEVLVVPSYFRKPWIACFHKWRESGDWTHSTVSGTVNEYVTHWMPLPSPPQVIRG